MTDNKNNEEPLIFVNEKGEKLELPADTSYEEVLRLTRPDLGEEGIQRELAKDRRYSWMVRFEVLAFLLIVIVILVLVFPS